MYLPGIFYRSMFKSHLNSHQVEKEVLSKFKKVKMEAFNLFYYGRFTSCIFIFQSIFGPNCTPIVVLAALFFTAPFSKPFSRPFAIKSNNYMTKLRVCLTQFSSKLHTVSFSIFYAFHNVSTFRAVQIIIGTFSTYLLMYEYW